MNSNPIHILLIEDDPEYADLLQETLSESTHLLFRVTWSDKLQSGIERLNQGGIDAVLLGFSLPDSQGLETFTRLYAQAPDVPIVVISGLDDEMIAVTAVRQGAQDYLFKGKADHNLLARTLHYAIERKQATVALQQAHDQQTHDQLEEQVAERTRQLALANEELKAEIAERKQSEMGLQRHTERLKVLQEIDRAILSAESSVEVANIALSHLRRLIPYHRTSVTLFDFEAGQAKVLAADVNGNTRLGAGELIPLDAFPGLAAMRQGRHYVTEDVLTLPVRSATDERLLVEGVRSSANVPLISQGKLIGSLNLGMADANMFGEESLEVAREVADQIVAAVQQSQLLAAAQRRVRESEAMAAVSQALNETLNLDQVLQLIANSARQIIPQAEGTVIHLLNEENQTLQPITVTKANQSNGLGLMMRPGEGIAGTVVLEGKLINVGDTRTDTRFLSHGKSSHRALLVAPIQSRVDKVGTITVQSAKSHAFSYADERLLSILGTQAALAIQNARLFEAEQQAHRIAETLRAANQALIQTLDLDKVLNVMLEYMFQLVPYDTAHIMLLEDDTRVVTRASRGYGHWDGNPDWARIIVFNKQHLTLHPILTAQQSVLIPDTREFSGWILQEGSEHVRCWLGVPLQAGGEVIGLYALNKAEPDFFTPEHQQLAESLAAQAAVAVQNALLYKMEREQFYRLQQSQAQLIQAEKMGALGRLVATIAHEVNNPIQAMTGCLTLVTEELDREQDREKVDLYLGIIKSELGRVATIVRNLREFYRSGQERLQPTDLHSVLESVLKLTSKQLQQSSVLVERMWVEELPTVQANPNHLKQVFLNLILNAIDAMLEGGTLRIVTVLDKMQLRNSLQVVTAVRIEVSDTGIGMPPEIVAHLFEPFFTTKDHGSGLGLSISYSIIEAHNGEFMVSSQVGSGTTFTILLPVTLS